MRESLLPPQPETGWLDGKLNSENLIKDNFPQFSTFRVAPLVGTIRSIGINRKLIIKLGQLYNQTNEAIKSNRYLDQIPPYSK